jgi:hypothetical protein
MKNYLKILIFSLCSLYLFLFFGSNSLAATTCQEKYSLSSGQCAYDCQSLGSNFIIDGDSTLCADNQFCCHQTASTSDLISSLELQIPLFDYAQAKNIPEYIAAIYKYALIVIVPLAILMIIIGGIMWLSAGGNNTQIKTAKSYITSALIGLIIALFSYLLFSFAGIENLKMPGATTITPKTQENVISNP